MTRSICLLIAAGCTSASFAVEPSGEPASVTAERLMSVVKVIERHHIDAPPKQELARWMLQGLAAHLEAPPPLGLGRRLSEVSSDEALAAELQKLCSGLLADPSNSPDDNEALQEIIATAVRDALGLLPGTNRLTDSSAHRVQEQFSGNRYVGIGIALTADTYPLMMKVLPGGAAADAGARDGERILEIDGVSTRDMPLAEVVKRLRGAEGSEVALVLQQPEEDATRMVTLTRGIVPMQHTRMETRKANAVIRFDRLTAGTVQDLREIEASLPQEIERVILDFESLREWNQHHAVMLADALLDGGEIGRIRTEEGVRTISATREALFRDRDLVVAVSHQTAGTPEWIAAALQDRKRATILGARTAGLPFVTTSHDVPGTDWVLELTTGILERADGTPLVEPDASRIHQMPSEVRLLRPQAAGSMQHARDRSRQDRSGGVVPDLRGVPPALRQGMDAVEPLIPLPRTVKPVPVSPAD